MYYKLPSYLDSLAMLESEISADNPGLSPPGKLATIRALGIFQIVSQSQSGVRLFTNRSLLSSNALSCQ